jgi:hypothetical protein
VSLGSITPLSASVFQVAAAYLGVKVGTDAEMTPRVRLLTTPFAFTSATLDGFPKESFLRADIDNSLVRKIQLSVSKNVEWATAVEQQNTGGYGLSVRAPGYGTSLVFKVTTDNVSNVMQIQKNGKIGIGVTTAYETLEVKGTVKATKFLDQDGNQIKSVDQVWSRPAPNADIYFLNANVGINNQYPSYQLDVSGNMRIKSKVLIGTGSMSSNLLTVGGNINATSFIGSGANLSGIGATSLATNAAILNLGGDISIGSTVRYLNQRGQWSTVNVTSGLLTARFPYFNGAALANSSMYQVGNYIGIGITNPSAELHVSGNIKTKTIDILGGADVAEAFEVSGIKPVSGMVMVIDEKKPGFLKVSTQAYDKKVAGIVSGANGLNPGVILNKNESLNGTKYPIALAGRVWVKVSDEGGKIEPGDLLTTSSKPGMAMKAKDRQKAQGAVIGKAMSGNLNGSVLVLVNLQ